MISVLVNLDPPEVMQPGVTATLAVLFNIDAIDIRNDPRHRALRTDSRLTDLTIATKDAYMLDYPQVIGHRPAIYPIVRRFHKT